LSYRAPFIGIQNHSYCHQSFNDRLPGSAVAQKGVGDAAKSISTLVGSDYRSDGFGLLALPPVLGGGWKLCSGD
jgi:hypothetical protein